MGALSPVFLVQGHLGGLPLELQLGMGPLLGLQPPPGSTLSYPKVRGAEAAAPAAGAETGPSPVRCASIGGSSGTLQRGRRCPARTA